MARFIMAGPWQAISFVLLFAVMSLLLPLMGILSNAAIGLVTLRLGWQRGLLVTVSSAALLSGMGWLMNVDLLTGFLASLAAWLPVVLLAWVLSQTVSWTTTLISLVIGSWIILIGFHLLVGDPVKYWQSQAIWTQLLEMVDAMQVLPADLPAATKQQVLDSAARILTGSMAMTLNVLFALSLLLARFWQSLLYHPEGFKAEWRQIQLGKTPALIMIGLIGLALLWPQAWLLDVVLAAIAIYLFQGLSLIHAFVAQKEAHVGWLIGVYLLLAIMTVQAGILIAAFGVIDGIADFRKLNTTQK